MEAEKEYTAHTRRWFKENYGVDPLKLSIPYNEKNNPIYKCASPMKLWEEKDVLPHKSEEGIEAFRKRSLAGKKAHETRKTNLANWFEEIKSDNPRVHEITRRLWTIGNKIGELHHKKAECRAGDECQRKDYWEYGMEHCGGCASRTRAQDRLRGERYELFQELVEICSSDKRTIQLARRYCREEGGTREATEA